MQTRTKRQKQVLEYLTQFINERGYEPSYQQIARALGIKSKGAIAKHIDALESQGLIIRTRENGSFKIELASQESLTDSACRIEWVDSVQDDKNTREALIISKLLVKEVSVTKIRAFEMTDDSMLDEGIRAGDIVLIEKRDFARDRDLVLARLEKNEVLLRRYYRQGADIELRPSNGTFESITHPADKLSLIGVYKSLLRPIG